MNNIQYTKYLFDSVNKISFANPGVIRDTYGKGENLTHDFLIKEANKFTKDISIDYGGNFLATYPGKLKKKIVIGSHLDSQKHGGNFDGLTGVIMGLVLIKFFFELIVFQFYLFLHLLKLHFYFFHLTRNRYSLNIS